MGYIEDLRKLIGHRPVILVGSVVVIVDEQDRVLLQERTFPRGKWGLPGGLMELGESTEDTARREVLEETGLIVEDLQLIHVFSGPEHFTKAANGDEFYVVTAAYYSKQYTGTLENRDKAETLTFRFFKPEEFPERMIGSHRMVLEEYLRQERAKG
ncbi:NUDIX hydrolase [Heyndrickxia acidicola]|uniref:NUDIX hydrolase n=1 Tax=Heyndrickxia acidicola TaxID=209389 RepID=A0ABU6MB55_9BACI|nr:NUDIX hydrolase [Heyndrickxia acidicola]MED1201871.1 NUDIX hydrolase [Heyndrickxia acidicola]